MYSILLSGGSGKRLWPLSNDARSKQFLKVLENSQGQRCSMVQRVWEQLQSVNMDKKTIIATSKSQVDMINSQLGKRVDLVVEPERRDTFPAIALAAVYLYSVKGVSLNEVISVFPVDPYVEDRFFEKVKQLEQVIYSSNADLALVGVKPTFPSEKYGYIVPRNSNSDVDYIEVSHFKEKPNQEQAFRLIEKKALWNCGVFAFKLNYIISMLEEKGLPLSYDALIQKYDQLEKISFDYAVVENAKKVVTIMYSGFWKDLGTWNTLSEEMSTNLIGNGIISDSTSNTHLINELGIPIAAMGLDNILIAASPDGILVTNKDESPKVKDLITPFDNRPMFEERRWGWYRVLDHTKFSIDNEVLTKRIGVKAGRNLSYQKHYKRSEVWTIIRGEGEFALNGEIHLVKKGDVLVIPVESEHGIKALTDLEFIEVQSGSEVIEEDIVRIQMSWDKVKQICT
jgi:mannose-1-phosphate guanylyltransferase